MGFILGKINVSICLFTMYTDSRNTNSQACNTNRLGTNRQRQQLITKQKLALGRKTNLKQQRWTTSQMEEISFAEVQTLLTTQRSDCNTKY